MVRTYKNKVAPQFNLNFYNAHIKQVTEVKYLELWIDQSFI